MAARFIPAASSARWLDRKKNDGDQPDLRAGAADAALVAYEQLRRYALAGSPRDAGVGGVLLLREGVATWIDRGAAGVASAAPSTAGDRVVAGAPMSRQLHIDVVHVLVSMALSGREAVSP